MLLEILALVGGIIAQAAIVLLLSPRRPGSLAAKRWWAPPVMALGATGAALAWMVGEAEMDLETVIVLSPVALAFGIAVAVIASGLLPRIDEAAVVVTTALYWFLVAGAIPSYPTLAAFGAAIGAIPTLVCARLLLSHDPPSRAWRLVLYGWWLVASVVLAASLAFLDALLAVALGVSSAGAAFLTGMLLITLLVSLWTAGLLFRGALQREKDMLDEFHAAFDPAQARPLALLAGIAIVLGLLAINARFAIVSEGIAFSLAYVAAPLAARPWRRAPRIIATSS